MVLRRVAHDGIEGLKKRGAQMTRDDKEYTLKA